MFEVRFFRFRCCRPASLPRKIFKNFIVEAFVEVIFDPVWTFQFRRKKTANQQIHLRKSANFSFYLLLSVTKQDRELPD